MSIMKSTPYPTLDSRDRRGFAEPERSLEKKNREKEEMRTRERTHANASTTPTRRKHAAQTRIHAFRAKQRAFLSSKALHNSTPFRGNLPSHTQEGLGFTRGKKCLGFARRERRRERFFGVDDRSSRVFASFRANSIAVQSNET